MPKTTAQLWGYNPPWIGGPQNIMSRQEDDRLIKNDLLQLLLTIPGERVMRPNFGVPLRSFVFEQFGEFELDSLENDIRSAIAEQEPRITVSEITLTPNADQRLTVTGRSREAPYS